MKKSTLIVVIGALLVVLSGCRKIVGSTIVSVEDPIRCYYPILQGEPLHLQWKIRNDGPNPLIIEDVLPSCPAITLTEPVPGILPAGDTLYLEMNYNTTANIGPTIHCIRIYGNISPNGVLPLRFGVRLVRPSAQHLDYEEQYFLQASTMEMISIRRERMYAPVDNIMYNQGEFSYHEIASGYRPSTDSLLIETTDKTDNAQSVDSIGPNRIIIVLPE